MNTISVESNSHKTLKFKHDNPKHKEIKESKRSKNDILTWRGSKPDHEAITSESQKNGEAEEKKEPGLA